MGYGKYRREKESTEDFLTRSRLTTEFSGYVVDAGLQ